MKAGDVVWGYADSAETERWTGAEPSREDAIRKGRAWFGEETAFYVMSGTAPAPSQFFGGVDLLDVLAERAGDEVGEASEDWPDLSREARAELNRKLCQLLDESIEMTFWISDSGEPERIEPKKGEDS